MSPTLPPPDETFPSLIPPFRALVEILAQCQETGTPFDCASKELRETDAALGGLLEAFKKTLPWRDLATDDGQVVAGVLEAFVGLRGMLASLCVGVVENDAEATARDVAAMKGQIRVLEAGLARLRESEAGRPVHSQVPAVNFILHVGRAVREGRKTWQVLATCLEALQPAWEALASTDGLPPEVEAHGRALEDLVQVVNAEDLDGLEAALEGVRVTGEALLDVGARMDASPREAPGFLCPRCGGAVGVWDRTCPSCSARMPERFGDGSVGTASWQTEDLPDHVQALFNAAEGLRAGTGEWDAFQACVGELRRRAERCLDLLERVPQASPGAPQDEVATWHASQESIENGLEKFFEGLEDLESLTPELDMHRLDRGLEAVVEAVRETRQVDVFMQRLLEARLGSQI